MKTSDERGYPPRPVRPRMNRLNEDTWMPLVARMCEERRALGGKCCGEWLVRSEAKLREANAIASTADAALWLAARAWALAAARDDGAQSTVGAGAGAHSAVHAPANAPRALALPGDLCTPGSVCAALLGGDAHGREERAGSECAWKAEFVVFCGQFIEVHPTRDPHLRDFCSAGASDERARPTASHRAILLGCG